MLDTINTTDPRESGISGLPGMSALEADEMNTQQPTRNDLINLRNRASYEAGVESVKEDVGLQYLNSGLGKSVYDKRISNTAELNNLGDFRANEQSDFLKVTNGITKGVVLAGTTFLDGTLGLVTGVGQTIGDAVKGKGFNISTVWNNETSKALKAVNDWAEQALPNYYTQDEIENPLAARNIFSANFLGDKLLKNLGFTVGAYYSGKTWATPLQLTNIIKNTKVAAATASGIGATISAVNEGRVEALNNSTDWYNLQYAQLKDTYDSEMSKIQGLRGTPIFDELAARYENNLQEETKKLEDKKLKIGNVDLALNLPILLASNLIEFGKLYSNGFNTARRIGGVTGKLGEYTATKPSSLKKLLVGTKAATSEGTEEVLQQVASNTAGNMYLPKDMDYSLSLKGAEIDNQAEEETIGFIKGLGMGITQAAEDDSTIEQFLIGALTGALGMPTFGKANNVNAWIGKNKAIGISGGAVGEIKDLNAEYKEAQEVADELNKRVQSPEFLNLYRGIIRHNKFQNDMDRAAREDKEKEFKDAEYAQMASDVIMFAKAGKLNDYRELIESAFDVSDENLEAIATNTTNKETGVGPFTDNNGNHWNKISEERKQEMIKKLTDSRDEMLSVVNNFVKTNDYLSSRYPQLTEPQRTALVWTGLLEGNARKRKNSILEDLKQGDIATVLNQSDFIGLSEEEANALSLINPSLLSMEDLISEKSSLIVGALHKAENRGVISTEVTNNIVHKLEDTASLELSIIKYKKEADEALKKPETVDKKEAAEVKKEEKKIVKKGVEQLNNNLSSATNFNDVRTILSSTEVDDATKSTAVSSSTNEVVKDYKVFTDKVASVRRKLSSLAPQLREDITAILDNVEKTADTIDDFNIKGLLMSDDSVLKKDFSTTTEDVDRRMDAALNMISRLSADIDSENNRPTVSVNEYSTEGAVFDSDYDLGEEGGEENNGDRGDSSEADNNGEVKGDVGNSEISPTEPVKVPVGKVSTKGNNSAAEQSSSNKKFTTTINEEGNNEYYPSSLLISETENEKLSALPAPTVEEDLGTEAIRPSTSQYDLSGMNSKEGVLFNEVPEAGRQAREYLSKNGPSFEGSTDAFEWVNKGELSKYTEEGGKIYFGIDKSLDPDTPIMFVKIGEEYKPVGILFKNEKKIDSFKGLREITDALRSEALNKEGLYISPNYTATVGEITSGRIPYRNSSPTPILEAMEGAEFTAEDAEIVVFADNKYFGNADSVSNYKVSGGGIRNGMSYIAVPNANRNSYKGGGKTLVPVIPVRFSQLNSKKSSTIKSRILSGLFGITYAIKNNDREALFNGISALSDYLNLTHLDVVMSSTGDVALKEIKTVDGEIQYVTRNGKIFPATTGKIIKLNPGMSDEAILTSIQGFLGDIGVPIRVNKNLVSDPNYVKELIEGDVLETYATTLKSEASWFSLNDAIKSIDNNTSSEIQKESTPNTTTQVGESTIEENGDLGDLDIDDILNSERHAMISSEELPQINENSLSEQGFTLDREYSVDEVMSNLGKVETSIPKGLVRHLLNAAKKIGVTYRFTNNKPSDMENSYGSTEGNKVELYIDPNNKEFIHTLLHETIHAFTSYMLNPNNRENLTKEQVKLVDELNDLFDISVEAGVTNEFGAAVSIDEFISELSNPYFREQLSRIKLEETNLFKKVVNWIKRLFGIQTNTVGSRLDRVLEQIIEYNQTGIKTSKLYMKPTSEYIGREYLAKLIKNDRQLYSSNKEMLIQRAQRINRIAGGYIASLKRGGVHENIQFYYLSIAEPTENQYERVEDKAQIRANREAIQANLTNDVRASLEEHYNLTEEDYKMLNESDIQYLLNCIGF